MLHLPSTSIDYNVTIFQLGSPLVKMETSNSSDRVMAAVAGNSSKLCRFCSLSLYNLTKLASQSSNLSTFSPFEEILKLFSVSDAYHFFVFETNPTTKLTELGSSDEHASVRAAAKMVVHAFVLTFCDVKQRRNLSRFFETFKVFVTLQP